MISSRPLRVNVSELEPIARLPLAAALGFVIGLERESAGMPSAASARNRAEE